MFLHKITYVGVDGVERTEEFAFGMTQTDVVRLSMRYPGGPEKAVEKLSLDAQKLMADGFDEEAGKKLEKAYNIMEDIVARSFGVIRGEAFIKNETDAEYGALIRDFKYHPAFSVFMEELMTSYLPGGDKSFALLFFSNLRNTKMTEAEIAELKKTILEQDEELRKQLEEASEESEDVKA